MSATPISEPEARALADAITQVSSSQPAPEALKMIEMALARAPQQPLVLNAAGGHMYRTGDARRAREFFERALAIDATSKVVWLNLAAACKILGDRETERHALDKALAIDPRYVLALLQKGDLMERLGKIKAAASVYGAAMASLAVGAPAPQTAAPAIAHAQRVIQETRRELEIFLEREVTAVRQQHAGADLGRYDACRDIFLGKRTVYSSQPRGFLFPYLPAIEFFERRDFPWLDILEAATDDIAAEALAALRDDQPGFRPYVDSPPGTPVDQWAALDHSLDWSVYSLWNEGAPIPEHIERCPKTAAVLSRLPLCDIPEYAPGAFFSVLKPHTRLPAHTGTTNTRSIVHLPLVVPPGCQFRVGSQVRTWERGKAWVFDDTIDHDAWNDSDQVRIILIFDIWNPLLTPAERDLVRAFNMGIGRFFGPDGPDLASR